jgi:hypothetical protein
MKIIIYNRFRLFLQKQRCEAAFDRAFYAHNGYTALDESLWEAGDAEYIFAHVFDWHTTIEGREFWREIDRRWNIKISIFYGTL